MDEQGVLGQVAKLHAATFGISVECLLERLKCGQHPGLVEGFKKAALRRKAVDDIGTAEMIKAAKGYQLLWDNDLLIKGPYCMHLSKALTAIGGYWDGDGGLNRRCFVVPDARPDQVTKAFGRASAYAARAANYSAQPLQSVAFLRSE